MESQSCEIHRLSVYYYTDAGLDIPRTSFFFGPRDVIMTKVNNVETFTRSTPDRICMQASLQPNGQEHSASRIIRS